VTAELLRRESQSLVERLRLWTPARWAAAAPSPYGTRGDVAHHLASALADLAADVEATPHRVLPRLDSDLALPDQLAVTADDLVRAEPPAALAARATAHLLLHRRDLLGEDVPAGLAAALGFPDVLTIGAQMCDETGTTALDEEQGAAPEAPTDLRSSS
jgi:hypothetical protein